jgi:UDP-GlcNAc:undecaprenyl-phosphate GlcNAc-1-phosphate transferase
MYLTIIGSIVGFLRFNFSKKSKIFMGDAGSLLLGFILVVSGIYLLNLSYQTEKTNNPQFLVPVLDSLRVYRSRIKRGSSPFKADKTHIHHLFLFIGISHKKTTLVISTASVSIALISASLCGILSITWGILIGSLLFAIFFIVLAINQTVMEWRKKVEHLENKV